MSTSYIKYTPLDDDEKRSLLNKLLSFLKNHSTNLKIDWQEIEVNKKAILDVIERVQQRRMYFLKFHGMEMGEVNEAALHCFWILKLKPFYFKDTNEKRDLNVHMAFLIFFKTLVLISEKKNIKFNLTYHTIEYLYYAFRHHDLSKEALMALTRVLAPFE